MKRHIYLAMRTLEQAREIFLGAFNWLALAGSETILTVNALNRITVNPIFAVFSVPNYHAAAMDGVAIKAEVTFRAADDHPLLFTVNQDVYYINTGQPLPEGTNAVIIIEEVYILNDKTIEIRTPAFPWQNVRKVGEDIVAHEMVLPHHKRIGAAELSALLTAGVFRIEVLQRPCIAIIATGTELLNWRNAEQIFPKSGQIIESNSTFLASLVIEYGGWPIILPCQPDHYESIHNAVNKALDSDAHIVIVNAGVSAGSKDYTARIIQELGRILVHGVTVMPGKPSILGEAKGKPIVGSPGYPISAWVCMEQFIRPALFLMQGQPIPQRKNITAIIARRLPSKLGIEEFLRVNLGRIGDNIIATPLKRGAASVTSLTRADGILRIPTNVDGIEEGTQVQVELLKPQLVIEKTLIVVGSHDITLDLLADYIKRKDSNLFMSSSNVGSLAGLIAIKNGRCHLGGTHLLDTTIGDYNISYIQKYLSEIPTMLITLAWRHQGLIVKKGNPKNIFKLSDLMRTDVIFINRQVGSGTRILLDYYLQNEKIDVCHVRGYTNEEYTHTGLALQVFSGGADCGLGILAAAQALDLDFVPICRERYDLCIPLVYQNDYRIEILIQVLNDYSFRHKVESLGGYDVEFMGQVVWKSP